MGLAAFNRMRRIQAEKEKHQVNEEKTLENMTVAELEEYAANHGIDLSGCKNKAEKLEKILSEGG